MACWRRPGRVLGLNLALAADEEVHDPGRLVGPSVAAEELHTVDDLVPLLETMAKNEQSGRYVLRHLVGALLAGGPERRPLRVADVTLWSAVAERLAETISPDVVVPLQALTWALSHEWDRMQEPAAESFGRAARALLHHAWNVQDRRLVRLGISAVAISFSTDPHESELLLRRVIHPDRLPEHGWEELGGLADQVGRLARVAPAFVADIYVAAFGYRDLSDATTDFGTGSILAMTDRRQDYDMARYGLAEAFPSLMAEDRPQALRALDAASLDQTRETDEAEVSFSFRGAATALIPDHSEYWDSQSGLGDHAGTMLDAYQAWIASAASDTPLILDLFDALSHVPHRAALWRRLLRAGVQVPGLAPLLEDLLSAPAILLEPATGHIAGEVLRVGSGHLDDSVMERVEHAVLSLPQWTSLTPVGEAS